MSFATNYGELKTAVANWLERDDLTTRIPEFIALGEYRIAKTVRVRELETSASQAMTIGQRNYNLPTNYVQFRRVYAGTAPNRLEYRSPLHYWEMYGNTTNGAPQVFTIEGDEILLGPPPNTSQGFQMLYYAKPTAFSSDSDTNDLLTTAGGLYLYAALIESAPFLGDDPRVLIWTQMYEDMLARTQEADSADRYSGDALVGKWPAQADPRAR